MNDHRGTGSAWATAWLIAAMTGLSSCGLLPSVTRPSPLELRSQSLSNGHLIAISSDRPIGTVTAFKSRGNWLVVTIVDSLVSFDDLSSVRPSFADSIEVTRFPGSLQIALRLTVQVSDVEVVQEPASRDIWISLFARRREH